MSTGDVWTRSSKGSYWTRSEVTKLSPLCSVATIIEELNEAVPVEDRPSKVRWWLVECRYGQMHEYRLNQGIFEGMTWPANKDEYA